MKYGCALYTYVTNEFSDIADSWHFETYVRKGFGHRNKNKERKFKKSNCQNNNLGKFEKRIF